MLFYQIRSHHHKTINLPNESCMLCKNKGVLKMHLLQQYADALFIPFLAGRKYATVECESCNKTLPNKLWAKELDTLYKQEKKALKTPLKLWSGSILVLVACLTVFTLFKARIANPFNFKRVNSSEAINKLNVQNFKLGDVLFVDFIEHSTESTNYKNESSLAKVIKIDGDKSVIKIYSDKFKFLDQYDLELSDVEDSKFKDDIEIKTAPLRKFGNLIYYDPPSEKMNFQAFGVARLVVKE